MTITEKQIHQSKKPHPIVQALINDSLRLQKEAENVNLETTTTNTTPNSFQKRIHSSAWRNRYSTAAYYPFQPLSSSSSTTTFDFDSTYSHGEENEILVKQILRGEVENTYGTGGTVWPAAIVLARYVEYIMTTNKRNNNTSFFKMNNNKLDEKKKIKIVDLGSGTGITSIVMANILRNDDSIQSSLILCTDGCDLVVKLAEENVKSFVKGCISNSNKANYDTAIIDGNDEKVEKTSSVIYDEVNHSYKIGNCEIRTTKYWWGDGSMKAHLQDGSNKECDNTTTATCDLILVADCLLPKLYPIEPLVDAIQELSSDNTVTLMTYEERYFPDYDPKEYFFNLINERDMEVRVVPIEEQHPVYSVSDILVFEVRKKKKK